MTSQIFLELRSDFLRYRPGASANPFNVLGLAFFHPGFTAVVFLRLQTVFVRSGANRLASLTRVLCLRHTGADFVPGCTVGPGLRIEHPNGIVVGGGVRVDTNCTLLQGITLGERLQSEKSSGSYPVIEAGVLIGAGAKVLGAVTVGAGSTVGANSVVLSDIPRYSTAVGIPARITKLGRGTDDE